MNFVDIILHILSLDEASTDVCWLCCYVSACYYLKMWALGFTCMFYCYLCLTDTFTFIKNFINKILWCNYLLSESWTK